MTGASLLLLGGLVVNRLDRETRPGEGALVTAVSGMLERCSGETTCLEREIARVVSITGAVDVVAAAAQVYEENPTYEPSCHDYMHMLGTHLTARVRAGDAPALGDDWTDCGAGLVHGAFEHIPVDPSDAARLREVAGLCDGAEFAEPLYRHHACLHAVGHAIHTGTGGNLARGEALCLEGVTADETFARNHPCLAGLYMVDRDERLAGAKAPKSPAGWEALLPHCRTSPRPGVCVTSYFELAYMAGVAEAVAYFDWCRPAGGTTCLYLLGQFGAFRQLADTSTGPGRFNLGTCLTTAAEYGLDPSPCTEGARQALDARGTAAEQLANEVCRLVDEARGRLDECA